MNYSNSQYGVWLKGFRGDESGSWHFVINGVGATTGVSGYNLQDGDVILLNNYEDWQDFGKTPQEMLLKYITIAQRECASGNYPKIVTEDLEDALDYASAYTGTDYADANFINDKGYQINRAIKKIIVARKKLVYVPSDIGVPSDFTNDLWLNTNYQILNVGDVYDLKSRRVPEIVASSVSPENAHPPYTYKIIYGDSVELANTNSSILPITAVKEGVSLIKVGYNATDQFNRYYDKMSAVNYSYMIVNVVADKDSYIQQLNSKLTTNINVSSYDTIYFTKGNTTPFSFNINYNGNANIIVNCNGKPAMVQNNIATVNLENRANVIEVTAIEGNEVYSLYYVIDARKIYISVNNITHPNQTIGAGDEVEVGFYGIVIPVYKLATIYNPTWYAPNSLWGPTYGTRVLYDNPVLGEVATDDPSQYGISKIEHNKLKFQLTNQGYYAFTNGHINEEWWGSQLGSEKDMTAPGSPNLNAPTNRRDFSRLPDFGIDVFGNSFAVDTFKFQDKLVNLEVGRNYDLSLVIKSDSSEADGLVDVVKYTSLNEDVATVDANGRVVGRSIGTVKILAEVSGLKPAICKVVVYQAKKDERDDTDSGSGGSSSSYLPSNSTNSTKPNELVQLIGTEEGDYTSEAMNQADALKEELKTAQPQEAVNAVNNLLRDLGTEIVSERVSVNAATQVVQKTQEVVEKLSQNEGITSEQLTDVVVNAIDRVVKKARRKANSQTTQSDVQQQMKQAVVEMVQMAIRKAGEIKVQNGEAIPALSVINSLDRSLKTIKRLSEEMRQNGMDKEADELRPVLYIVLSENSEYSFSAKEFTNYKAKTSGVVTDFTGLKADTKKDNPKLKLDTNMIKKIVEQNADLDVQLGGAVITLNPRLLKQLENEGLVLQKKDVDKSSIQNMMKSMTEQGFYVKLVSNIFDINLTSGDKEIKDLSKSVRPRVVIEDARESNTSVMAVYDDTSGKWQVLPTKAEGRKFSALAPHFSKYAVVDVKVNYDDIDGNWAEKVIKNMAANGIVEPRSKRQFAPNENITRAEFAAYLVNMLGLEGSGRTTFKDIPTDAWYKNAVSLAADNNLVSGIGEGKFAPNANITRQDMAVMIASAYKNMTGKEMSGRATEFNDSKDISKYAIKAVVAAKANKIVGGFADGTFKPMKNASRGEATQMLKNLFDLSSSF